MNTLKLTTPWYTLDADGPPITPGWYECLFEGDDEDDEEAVEMIYWNGLQWLTSPAGLPSVFGTGITTGERWRGALTPQGGMYV